MTVLTNAFSAEYGASTGSVVNINTRSGGERIHGNFYGNWRPTDRRQRSLATPRPTLPAAIEITSDRLMQEGFAFGGPVKFAPKTRFFVAGEHSDEDKASPVTSAIDPPVVFKGVYHDWMGLARLDHQFSEKHNGFCQVQCGRLLRHQSQRDRRRGDAADCGAHVPSPHVYA